jgi:hypothetical protein
MDMKNELTLKQPSDELKQLIDQAVRHVHTSAEMVEKAIVRGKSEGFSDKQIGHMIRSHMLSLGYDPSTIRKALPSSAKDTTKTRKDYLARQQYNNNELYERKIPSYQNRNRFGGNRTSEQITKGLKHKISELESQLDQERDKNEDITIQNKNATIINSELRGQLEAVRNVTSILVITRDNFPPDYGRVFSSQDYVFGVKFRHAKVLDVSVMTLKQIQEQTRSGSSSKGSS